MRTRAPGFTILELLVVTILGAVILAGIYRTLTVQERTSRQRAAMLSARHSSRLALETLAAEVRAISPAGGDLSVASPESLSFRAFREFGIICGKEPSDAVIDVWMVTGVFAAGDSILVYVDGDALTAVDDRWVRATVEGVATGDCAGHGSRRELRLKLPRPWADPLRDSVRAGAPVRGFTHIAYGIYRFGDDWMLGRRGQDERPVALIGPLAAPDRHGLEFRYFSANGRELIPAGPTDRERVAGIEVVVRDEEAAGAGDSAHPDSLVTRVFLRGN